MRKKCNKMSVGKIFLFLIDVITCRNAKMYQLVWTCRILKHIFTKATILNLGNLKILISNSDSVMREIADSALVKVSDWNLFRTNPIYSEICVRVNPNPSESIRKKNVNLVWCKSVENLSNLIRVNLRLWIRMNLDNFWILMNPRSELFEWIRIEGTVQIILTSNSFGLRTSFGLIQIRSLGLSRIKSDWILVRIKYLGLRWIDF